MGLPLDSGLRKVQEMAGMASINGCGQWQRIQKWKFKLAPDKVRQSRSLNDNLEQLRTMTKIEISVASPVDSATSGPKARCTNSVRMAHAFVNSHPFEWPDPLGAALRAPSASIDGTPNA